MITFETQEEFEAAVIAIMRDKINIESEYYAYEDLTTFTLEIDGCYISSFRIKNS